MASLRRFLTSLPRTLSLAGQGLRTWGPRQILVAAGVALAFGLLLGLATVLIPNPVFTREIPPVWWNYPVWVLTSVLSGMLVATYVQGQVGAVGAVGGAGAAATAPGGGGPSGVDDDNYGDDKYGDSYDDNTAGINVQNSAAEARRSSRLGFVGAMLAWFAVGCPVCNKLALLALGYSGAISWFAPVQPFMAIVALVLTAVALVVRLRGQIECVLPAPRVSGRVGSV